MVTSGESEEGKDKIRVKDEEVQNIMYEISHREFSGHAVVKTWCFHCCEPRFNPFSGN